MECNQPQTSRPSKQNNRTADIYITHLGENIYDEIEEGTVEVASTEFSLDRLIKIKSKESKDHFRVFVKQELNELAQGYRKRGSEGSLCLSKENHKEIVHRIISERKKQDRRREQSEREREQREQKVDLRRKREQSDQRQRMQRDKLKKLRQRLLGMEKQRYERKDTEEKAQIRYKQVRSQKTTHEYIQERYHEQVTKREIQQRTARISQIKQNHKQNSIKNIPAHEKSYLNYLAANQIRASKVRQAKWQYTPPQRPHRLQRILEEQNIKVRLKMEAKKRALSDREARLANFIHYLKDHFSPNQKGKQSYLKSQETSQLKSQLKSKLKSELKSQSMEQSAKVETVNGKLLGLGYLAQVRALRKKPKVQSERHKTEQVRVAEIPRRQSTGLSISRKKGLQIKAILASALNATDKCQKIKQEVEQLQQRTAMAEQLLKVRYQEGESQQLTELLLLEVQAKLAILGLQV